MKIHPHDLTLEGLLLLLESERRALARHLSECPTCRERLEDLPSRKAAVVRPFQGQNKSYDAAFNRLERLFEDQRFAFEQERAEARGLLTELLRYPVPRRKTMVRQNPRFQTWSLAQLVIELSKEECFQDPALAEDLAWLTLDLLGSLDKMLYGAERIEDLKARSWGVIGNARRVRSDFQAAEEAFETAAACLKHGTGDVVERALLFDLKASLRIEQRRLDEAMTLLHRALALFRSVGDRHRTGRTLIKMDRAYNVAGTPAEGIPLLYQALDLIDPDHEPRLTLCVSHNLITDFVDSELYMEAQRMLAKTRPLYERNSDPMAKALRPWLEGRIAWGLGRKAEAEAFFYAAREALAALGNPYRKALLLLDLAALYAEQGKTSELRRITEEILPVFTERKVTLEAEATLALLQKVS
jgi:tetratricopeptide (TPR) repeat protein